MGNHLLVIDRLYLFSVFAHNRLICIVISTIVASIKDAGVGTAIEKS